MSGSVKRITQLMLIFVNFLFAALGLTCVGVGGWVLIDREEARVLTLLGAASNDLGLLQNAAILLIAAGITLFALGILGCCAAYRDQRCLRVIYLCLVTLCSVVSVTATVVGFMFRDQVEEKLLNHLREKLTTDYEGFTTSPMDFSRAFDYAQVEFECCGIRNYSDFRDASKWTVKTSATIPPTCCRLTNKNDYLSNGFISLVNKDCVISPDPRNSHIEQPCHGPLKNWMTRMAIVMGAIAIATIFIQVLGLILMTAVMKQHSGSDVRYRDTLHGH